MVKPQSWESFRNTGLFVFVNSFLHLFGWAIVLDISDNEIVNVYPAKVDFAGFPEEDMDKAYMRVKTYLATIEDNK